MMVAASIKKDMRRTKSKRIKGRQPMVSVGPLAKYAVVGVVRMHTEYTPAVAPESLSARVM